MKLVLGLSLFIVATVITQPQLAHAQLTSGLVGHYLFDGNANDISGNDFHGTLFNGVTSTTDRFGRSGGALLFDGSDDRIRLHHESIHGLTNLTMSFWIQTTQTVGSRHFVSAARASQNNEFLIAHTEGATYVADRGSFGALPSPVFNDGTWHHLAVTRSSSGVDLYLGGAWASHWAHASSPLTVDPGGFWLGGDQDYVGGGWQESQQFGGSMDDVRIYNRALSASDVGDLYLRETVPEPSALLLLGFALSSLGLVRRRTRKHG